MLPEHLRGTICSDPKFDPETEAAVCRDIPQLMKHFVQMQALPLWSQHTSLLQQFTEHSVQIQDLKRRCAEKDQAVRPLEQQVQRLQEDRQRIEQELEEANRDRYCYAVLRCAVLCCAVLCCAALCRAVPCLLEYTA